MDPVLVFASGTEDLAFFNDFGSDAIGVDCVFAVARPDEL
jgi:hypothetical protein